MAKDANKDCAHSDALRANRKKNFARAVDFIRDAAKKGAQIVCLPELFRSQYFCQTEDHKNFELAEKVSGSNQHRHWEMLRGKPAS